MMKLAAALAALVTAALALQGCGDQRAVTTPTPTATAVSAPVLYPGPDCGPAHTRPSSVVLACADGGVQLSGLRWHGWGDPAAQATGAFNIHGCDPNCADDNTTHTYAVSVTASDLVTCPGGRRQYTSLAVRVTDEHRDANRPDDGTYDYKCPEPGEDQGAGSPGRPGSEAQAKYDAQTVAKLVERCYFKTSTYNGCDTAAALKTSPTGRPPLRVDSDSPGAREVGVYPRDGGEGYEVIAYTDDDRGYSISMRQSDPTPERTCLMPDGETPCDPATW